jgi:hypothetical protein
MSLLITPALGWIVIGIVVVALTLLGKDRRSHLIHRAKIAMSKKEVAHTAAASTPAPETHHEKKHDHHGGHDDHGAGHDHAKSGMGLWGFLATVVVVAALLFVAVRIVDNPTGPNKDGWYPITAPAGKDAWSEWLRPDGPLRYCEVAADGNCKEAADITYRRQCQTADGNIHDWDPVICKKGIASRVGSTTDTDIKMLYKEIDARS